MDIIIDSLVSFQYFLIDSNYIINLYKKQPFTTMVFKFILMVFKFILMVFKFILMVFKFILIVVLVISGLQ